MLGRELYPLRDRLRCSPPRRRIWWSSSTLTEDDTSWPTTRIVGIDEVRALKEQPGQAVYVVGVPRLMTSLLHTGVLDEST